MPDDVFASIEAAFSLEGETALVTGGASGIGYGIARCFVAAGARVVLVGRRKDALTAAVKDLGGQACAEPCDITNLDALPGLLDRVTEKAGPISIVVNCAGNHIKKTAFETTSADLESVLRTHVVSAFELSRLAAFSMAERKSGSILFIASMASYLAMPMVTAYTTAKTGLVGLTRSLSADLSPHGIRVNAIAPGWIETQLLRQALQGDTKRRDKILGRTPMARFGHTSDIGWAAVYLCSPAAHFVTGVVFPVDGGGSIGF